MPSPVVVLAHAPEADSVANSVRDDLAALGFSVDRANRSASRRAQAAKIESAHRVVVLWSRAARGTPALRAAVRRASARGTLVCVSLDTAPPPPGVQPVTKLPRSGAAWRGALAKRKAIAAKIPPAKKVTLARTAVARREMLTKQAEAAAKAAPAKKAILSPVKATRAKTSAGAKPPIARPSSPSKSGGAPVLGVLGTLVVLGVAASAVLYQFDPNFATKVKSLAGEAQVQVTALTGKH